MNGGPGPAPGNGVSPSLNNNTKEYEEVEDSPASVDSRTVDPSTDDISDISSSPPATNTDITTGENGRIPKGHTKSQATPKSGHHSRNNNNHVGGGAAQQHNSKKRVKITATPTKGVVKESTPRSRSTTNTAEKMEAEKLSLKEQHHPSMPSQPPRAYKQIYCGILLHKRYEIRKNIGAGAYAEIYEAWDYKMKGPVAIKILKVVQKDGMKRTNADVESEITRESWFHLKISKKISRGKYVPVHYAFCMDEKYGPFIVMQLLGADLGTVRRNSVNLHRKLSIAVVARIGKSAVTALENVHNLGHIHRDLKPQNLLTGYVNDNMCSNASIDPKKKAQKREAEKNRALEVYLCDYGFAKEHIKDGVVIPQETKPNFRGTAPYSSLRSLEFKDQSRRDDMEALLFVLLELMLGGLPWTKLICDQGDRRLRDRKIHDMKKQFIKAAYNLAIGSQGKIPPFKKLKGSPYCGPFEMTDGTVNPDVRIFDTPPDRAVNYIPGRLLHYLIDVHKLEYDAKPNYDKLRAHLTEIEETHKADTMKFFKTSNIEEAYYEEIAKPILTHDGQYMQDCIQFWHSGVCFNKACRLKHTRTAAPEALLNAFRGKRMPCELYDVLLGNPKDGAPDLNPFPSAQARARCAPPSGGKKPNSTTASKKREKTKSLNEPPPKKLRILD